MKSVITITPTSNIVDFRIVDQAQIKKRTCDRNMDVFTFYNVKSKETRKSNLTEVSLYDDLIVEGDIQYKILHMYSKK